MRTEGEIELAREACEKLVAQMAAAWGPQSKYAHSAQCSLELLDWMIGIENEDTKSVDNIVRFYTRGAEYANAG